MTPPKDVGEELPPVKERSAYLRSIFGFIWIFLLWFVALLLVSAVSMDDTNIGGEGGVLPDLILHNFMDLYSGYIENGIILVGILLSVLGILPGTSKMKGHNRLSTKIVMVMLLLFVLISAVFIFFSLKHEPIVVEKAIPNIKISFVSRTARSFDISNDGKTLILLDGENRVLQFSLRKGWDLNSIEYTNVYYSLGGEDEIFTSVKFGRDGKKLYATKAGVSSSDKNLYRDGYLKQFKLVNPFSLDDVEYQDVDINCRCSYPMGVSFNETGEYMHVIAFVATLFRHYRLESPYDISTATYIGRSMISKEAGYGHLSLSRATKDIYYTIEGKSANQFKASFDDWDRHPELTYDSQYLDLHNLGSSPVSILSHPEGEKVFVLTDDAKIYTYYLETPFELKSAKPYRTSK